jgi:uncharacterized protein YbaP (TraB family)
MEKNKWFKLKKGVVVSLIVTTTMLGSVANVFASDVQVPQISSWSVATLNEGEKYGIFPMEWYYDGFQKEISQEKLQSLILATTNKLDQIGFEKNDAYVSGQVYDNVTRENVVISLSNILTKYKLPEDFKLENYTAVEYMKTRGILVGTDRGLELDTNCTVEQATVLAIKLVEDTYNLADAGSKGLVWKATKGDNTVYMLGSIHIGDSSLYPINKELKEAFKKSDALLVEANLLGNQQELNYFINKARYADGTTLKDHVSEAVYDKAMLVFDKFKLPAEQYVACKPWAIANDLTVLVSSDSSSMQQGSQAANLGVDLYFTTTSMVDKKTVVELEGIKAQADLFDGLSSQTQEKNLNDILDSALNPENKVTNEAAKSIELWQQQWKSGDIEAFTKSYSEAFLKEENEFSKMLLGKRDQAMAEKIGALLDREGKATYFVVVGAAHLALKDMVIDQLKDKGYTVQEFK